MDLHRRRSVLVRITAEGRKLETVRLTNSPAELLRVIARVGKRPKVVLEATCGGAGGGDQHVPAGHSAAPEQAGHPRTAVALSVTLSVYGQMSNRWWSQGG
jgi:hypothetical protein